MYIHADAPGLECFGTEPEQEPEQQRHTQPVPSHTSTFPDWRIAVPTGALAIDPLSVPSWPSDHALVPAPASIHAADAPLVDSAPAEKLKRTPVRPRMRPPPPADNDLLPDTALVQPTQARRAPVNAPALDTAATDTVDPTQHTPQVPTVKKRTATDAGLEPELALKKPQARSSVAKQPRAPPATANTVDSPAEPPVPSAPGPAPRRAGLRSSKAVAAAVAATKSTEIAFQKSLKAGPQKGKQPAMSSWPLSVSPVHPQSEDPSDNDDGFRSLEEDY